jgi:bacterial/archaeal transporter family-2 protein
MPSGTAIAVGLVALGGLAGAIQAAVMGRFGERIGTLEVFAYATLVTAAVAAAMLVLVRQGFDGYVQAAREPRSLLLAPVSAVIVVLGITYAAPRIGTTATVGILTAGNLATAAVIDRYGAFGVDQIPLTGTRVAGVLLLGLGAALVLIR